MYVYVYIFSGIARLIYNPPIEMSPTRTIKYFCIGIRIVWMRGIYKLTDPNRSFCTAIPMYEFTLNEN